MIARLSRAFRFVNGWIRSGRGCPWPARERAAGDPAAGPFLLRLAPDRFHKQRLSGGGPYGVIVPDAGAEGIFVAETTMPFVSYLNWVFLSGGFPWPDRFTYGSKVQWALGKGLLPL